MFQSFPVPILVWLHRFVLAGLLLAAYLWAWTPGRAVWVTQGAALVERVAPASDDNSPSVVARPEAPTIHLQTADGTAAKHTAPAGVKFLLPALFLVLIAPRRPRLGGFFAGHLALGAGAVALLASGMAGLPGGIAAAGFVEAYAVDAYSLAVPVFVLVQSQRGPHR